MKKITILLGLAMISCGVCAMEQQGVAQLVQKISEKHSLVFTQSVLSPDRTKLAALTSESILQLWNIEDGDTATLGDPNVTCTKVEASSSIGFNERGTHVIVHTSKGDEEYDIIDPAVLKIIMSEAQGKMIQKLQNADKTQIVTVYSDGDMRLIHVSDILKKLQ